MIKRNIDIPKKQISEFCRRWRISELALFGSVLHDDFDSNSDVDILATFAPGADWSLLDHLQMEQELADLLDRKIDLFSPLVVKFVQKWQEKFPPCPQNLLYKGLATFFRKFNFSKLFCSGLSGLVR